jgi:hypothetical protein
MTTVSPLYCCDLTIIVFSSWLQISVAKNSKACLWLQCRFLTDASLLSLLALHHLNTLDVSLSKNMTPCGIAPLRERVKCLISAL